MLLGQLQRIERGLAQRGAADKALPLGLNGAGSALVQVEVQVRIGSQKLHGGKEIAGMRRQPPGALGLCWRGKAACARK